MGRHKKSIDRPLMPDVKYNSRLVSKFVCRMMLDGKKQTCFKIVYQAMDNLKAKTDKDPLEVFNKAIENVKPMVEVKSRRVGGSNYQVPVEVKDDRAQTLALRWLVNYAKLRNGKGMAINLANEIIDASNNTGGACKKREDTHRMAEANKAFAHYRW